METFKNYDYLSLKKENLLAGCDVVNLLLELVAPWPDAYSMDDLFSLVLQWLKLNV